jgi:broad specificity phosphatase PhoE
MSRIYLVRHGKAAAGFGEDMDPGLDDLGRSQAVDVAQKLKDVGPMPIITSPLRRTQETAAPLAALWHQDAAIEQCVAEIPSPKGMSLEERVGWLRQFMAGSWLDAPPELAQWRQSCVGSIAAIKHDAVVFSHYVAINVLMGMAVGDDKVVVFSPENCSVTVFDNAGGKLALIDKGSEAPLTKVN